MMNTAYFLGTAGFSTNLHPIKEVRNKKPKKFKNRLNGDSFTVNKQCFGELKASQVFIVFRSCFQCFYISYEEKRSFEITLQCTSKSKCLKTTSQNKSCLAFFIFDTDTYLNCSRYLYIHPELTFSNVDSCEFLKQHGDNISCLLS